MVHQEIAVKKIKYIALLTLGLISLTTSDRAICSPPDRSSISIADRVTKIPPLLWTGTYIFTEGRGRIRILTNGLERYGYVDRTGKIVISPKYLASGNFAQGLAPVQFINQKYGFIDRGGKTVVAAKYDLASGFVDGLAVVQIGGKMGAIDRRGKLVIQPVYTNSAGEFQAGLLAVKQGNLWGFVDRQGQMVIKPQFVDPKLAQLGEEEVDIARFYLHRFSDGLAAVTRDGVNYGYINNRGEMVIPPMFKYARAFTEGLGLVQTQTGTWGLIDRTGKMVTSFPIGENIQVAEVALLSILSEGLAGVKIGTKWGFIDRQGNQVISPQFENIYPFSEGLAGVVIKGKYGFIDRQGKMVIPPTFDRAFSFQSSLAPVVIGEYGTVNARVGYIDRTGKLVIQQPPI